MNIQQIGGVNQLSFGAKKADSHFEEYNGVKGVWIRDGGNYAFFTPADEIKISKPEQNKVKTESKPVSGDHFVRSSDMV